MRICLIGDITGNIDEGMKKMSYNIYITLSKNAEVIILNPYSILTLDFWRRLIQFKPNIINYMTGPSLKSLFVMKVISIFSIKSNKIITVSHPKIKFKSLVPLLKTKYAIVHSERTAKMFSDYGFKTEFIPNGVDTDKFVKPSYELKMYLRKKYSIPENKYVILHVGNILAGRNIVVLKGLQKGNNQVIIVGSTSIGVDVSILNELNDAGCIVITDFIKDIHELYQLADCYIFPVLNEIRAIECPLSVLEAAACNLPIISTKFGGLQHIFEEKDGFYFVNTVEEISVLVENVKLNVSMISTRNQVKDYSWENIGLNYLSFYEKTLAKD